VQEDQRGARLGGRPVTVVDTASPAIEERHDPILTRL
jgi:hypothetical protein